MMKKRRWLPPLGSILFGLMLLVAAEGLLRFAWSPPLLPREQLVAVTIDPFEVNNGNAQTKEVYLGAMRPSSFVVPKPPGTFRVFCLGGSTTLGYPYPAETAWPASLERRLERLFPERDLEVINVGATSYGSARTLAVLRGIIAYQPDLVIIATGDAEFVEDSFRVAVAMPTPVVSWLHGLYLSRAFKQVLPAQKLPLPVVDAEDSSAAGFLFAPVVAGTVYQVDMDRRRRVMSSLDENLTAMTEAASNAAVPLMLVTLPANIASWPPDPDHSMPAEPAMRTRWQQHLSLAERLAASGPLQEALDEYAAATNVWGGNATVCYEYGQLLIRAEQFDKARTMLLRALDLDPTPVRATSIVNQSIRSAAAQADTMLADPVSALTVLSSHGLLGEELILDYAHPTPWGHVEIARVVLQALITRDPGWAIDDRQELSAHELELARLTAEKPVVNAKLSFALGQIFERKGLEKKAVEMYQQAITQGYQGPFAIFNLARLLALQGRYAEALTMMTPLVSHYPEWQEPYALLGFLHQQLGDITAALGWYRKAVEAGDTDPRLSNALAELEVVSGQPEQARSTLEAALRKNPGNCDLASSLGRLLEQAGDQGVRAEDFYRKQLAADPTCQLLWENLGLLLMQQQRWQDAEQVFTAALRQPAALAQHHLNLGYVYYKGLNNKPAAGEQFARFLSLAPDRANLVPSEFRQVPGSGVQ